MNREQQRRMGSVRQAASQSQDVSGRIDELAVSASRAQEEAARFARLVDAPFRFIDREGEQMEADLRAESERAASTL